jgi:hypothetical protein
MEMEGAWEEGKAPFAKNRVNGKISPIKTWMVGGRRRDFCKYGALGAEQGI